MVCVALHLVCLLFVEQAEVTGGGIPLTEINTKTLESHEMPGTYICGELLDVFGRIGGFNFYWAWVTGRLAGISAARSSCRPEEPMVLHS